MSEDAPAVNHHAEHPGFAGPTGAVFGLLFLLTGKRNAQVAVRAARVEAGDHVVDIGCGPGTAARRAARCGARVSGIDPSSVMLRLARAATRGRAGIVWAQGCAEALPVPDGAATVVWALSTVHHWHDVTRGLAEAVRVLAHGGRLLAVERVSPPGATGVAGHGWTTAQAEAFADHCRAAGLIEVTVREQDSRWTVLARRP
ncbi:class I SAM-dependent methyltransferase [Mycolicibacterium bacteremicum]|uniref:SAM-dependent methyltransferase n=1 Tax=Mycolicibacterium bacteremicum TaxID=564198 RepID=A0A1W9YV57_MYCBA|nr:class I SAM-dependent methyltransferase [Mycolicibacterium bacteremicum]MCV7434393.1 class I SAM-dependent methyltransferase [Mycolicibacterium bacteremicum]ORA03945.1 SAM-dependent methyltransferase [Mycolicibacterium bacteremicum]